MTVETYQIRLKTQGDADAHNISEAVANILNDSPLMNGLATVFCPSATSGVTTIEFEEGCVTDMRRLFDEVANPNRHYAHNARWGDGNGHSHVRAALLGPSITIPFANGRLTLGTWQQIIYLDFDNRPRQRELVVQLMGE
ncbi:MAG: secondary thiamine-phosphate synthase enzyme YjbQ [Chloroflexota bacterium]